VGRGTATYDGISIAWAATEYLHNTVGAKTLFATHYHELTSLADHLDRVANVHVAAEERDGDVTFLRTVREGPTDRSYGVHVADLAGVPDPVVTRSREVLDRLREEKAIEARGGGERVQAVFDLGSGQFQAGADTGDTGTDEIRERYGEAAEAVLAAVVALDVNETPPVELMSRVQDWQEQLE
jgi:DNA mismatch repair protein MutS